jgi:quercetin dioxygenase-like cupin family protein
MEASVSSRIGGRLRALRNERGYSLVQVAAATKISKSFLVLVEGGRSDITITRLMRLTQFYGVHIADVLPDTSPPDEVVVRRGAGQHVYSPAEKIDVQLLSKHAEPAMSPVLMTMAPLGESEPSTHEGEEFLFVLSGQLTLQFDDDEPIVLEQGDSAYFNSARLHTYTNRGATDVNCLSIVTPAVF